jgi:thiopeptide-type bacteriocin biosynthesis protein
VDLARHLLGEAWEDWLLRTYPRGPHQAAFREHRAVALRTVDPYGDWAALRAEPGGDRLLAAWRHRATRLAEYGARLGPGAGRVAESLLHMHHNRLAGLDTDGELRMYAIARGAVQAHLDRRRHGRAPGR